MSWAEDPPRACQWGGPDRIELRGLRAVGAHGALEEERRRAQPFEVDVDLYADLSRAGRSDTLADTVDYGAVAGAVVAVIAGPHADLLECLAERVADAIFATAGVAPTCQVTGVRVTVRKLRPPVPADLRTAAVTIHRACP